jgi:hypothetical protein
VGFRAVFSAARVRFATPCRARSGADLEHPVRSGAKQDWNAPAPSGTDLERPVSSDFIRPTGPVGGLLRKSTPGVTSFRWGPSPWARCQGLTP